MIKCKKIVNKMLTNRWPLLIFGFLMVTESTSAQNTLGTQLLGAAGGTSYNGNLGLTFSLGETIVDQSPQATFGVLQHDPLGTPTVKVTELSTDAMNLFPNPNRGEFQISAIPEGSVQWQVFDLNGRLLERGRITNNQFRLEATWAQGLYLFRLLDESGVIKADLKFTILH